MRRQRCYRREKLAPVANGSDADLSQVVCGELRQNFRVDIVGAELLLVLTEAEAAKPLADIHGAPHVPDWTITWWRECVRPGNAKHRKGHHNGVRELVTLCP